MTAVHLPSAAAATRAVTVPGTTAPLAHRPGAPGGGARPRLALPAMAETWLAIGVVVVVALLVMPLPPFMLDAFLALSMALSIVILLLALSVRDPLEFSVFPSLLLLITLLRLGLNVSSTRLILSTGHAGEVIAAFGDFVIAGNPIVGLVIFLILVVINFMVITKGAGRIAEVAARFTLDAMPGRQMSIDADLGAGLIDETEARRRREEISRYADFYGSMDGAAKFVRGDAIAGLIITAINLLGGFVIGMAQMGLPAGESLALFSGLTVGDGLVTQIPALVVSTAAGMLVTYGSGGGAMAPSLAAQMTRNPRALWTSGGLLGGLALVPGLPSLPFLTLSAVLCALGWAAGRRPVAPPGTGPAPEPAGADTGQDLKELLAVEPLEIEVGYGLVPLADEAQGGDLLKRFSILRKQLAVELGVVVPPVRVRDNIQRRSGEYAIKLRGVPIAGAELLPKHLLAIDASGGAAPIEGVQTRDPSFGLPAVWIAPDHRPQAEAAGWEVVEPATVLSTHLMESVREHAAELLTRQGTRELLDGLRERQPALVDDVVPNRVSLGVVHRVLQRLLREGIPVRDLASILEVLTDAAEQTREPEALTEHVRRALSSTLVQLLASEDGSIRALTVGPRLEVALMQLFAPRTREAGQAIEPEELSGALRTLAEAAERHQRDGQLPPLVTPPALRVGLRRLVEPVLPRLPVVSLAELPPQTPIQNLHTWELSRADRDAVRT